MSPELCILESNTFANSLKALISPLSFCVYVCVHIYMHVYAMCVCVNVSAHPCVCMRICECMGAYLCVCTHVYVCERVYMHA